MGSLPGGEGNVYEKGPEQATSQAARPGRPGAGHSFSPIFSCREAAGAGPEGVPEERQHGQPCQPATQEEQRHGPDEVGVLLPH